MLLRIRILMWIITFPYSSTQSDTDLEFTRQYVSQQQFQSLRYNILTCDEQGDSNLFHQISNTYHGMTRFHVIDKTVQFWHDGDDEPQTFIADINCPGMRQILEKANEMNLFRKPFNWLLLDHSSYKRKNEEGLNATNEGNNSEWYWKFFENLDILPDSEFQLSKKIQEDEIRIMSIYKIAKSEKLIIENLSTWSLEKGFVIQEKECPAIRRSNLQGIRISAIMVLTTNESLLHLEDMVDKHIDSSAKVAYLVFKDLAAMINVTLNYQIVNSFGENMNGNWTGMFGAFQTGSATIGITPSILNSDRLSIAEYYDSITPFELKFIFISPPLSYSNNIFTLPFDSMVWYCCMGMLVVSSIVLYVAVRIENKNTSLENDNNNISEKSNHLGGKIHNILEDSISDIVMLNVGAICLQGTVAEPKGPSGRIITLFLYFSYMFLYVSYSACIVALLQSSDTSIRTLKDLLRSPLSVGADDAIDPQNYLQAATDKIRKDIYDKKLNSKGESAHFLPVHEGIEKVRKGLYAFHTELNKGYTEIQKTFTEDEKCGLQELQVSYFPNLGRWLAMKKHSPYSEIIKIGMKKLITAGIKNRELRRIYSLKPVCGSRGSSFVSVGLIDVYPGFMVLVYGLLSSIFIIFVEKCVKNQDPSKSKSKDI